MTADIIPLPRQNFLLYWLSREGRPPQCAQELPTNIVPLYPSAKKSLQEKGKILAANAHLKLMNAKSKTGANANSVAQLEMGQKVTIFVGNAYKMGRVCLMSDCGDLVTILCEDGTFYRTVPAAVIPC